ncbi:ribosomal protein S18-alanine N-acetyltransferase [soil metagenome]
MAVFQSIRNLFSHVPVTEPELIIPAPECEYSLKPLTSKNLNEVLRLNLRCFAKGENYTKHTFTYLLNDPQTLSYQVVTEMNEMVGFIVTMMNADGSAHITTIGVSPEHRRRNIAGMMLDYLERALAAKGITTVVLEVRVGNVAAQNLYRRGGYACVQRMGRYYSNGEDGFMMMKALV